MGIMSAWSATWHARDIGWPGRTGMVAEVISTEFATPNQQRSGVQGDPFPNHIINSNPYYWKAFNSTIYVLKTLWVLVHLHRAIVPGVALDHNTRARRGGHGEV